MKKGRRVDGTSYVEADEEYNKKMAKKTMKGMKTAGLAKELKESQKEEGYSNKPKVKPQKKNRKPVSGQRMVD